MQHLIFLSYELLNESYVVVLVGSQHNPCLCFQCFGKEVNYFQIFMQLLCAHHSYTSGIQLYSIGGKRIIILTKPSACQISWTNIHSLAAIWPMEIFPMRGKATFCLAIRISLSNSWLWLNFSIPLMLLRLLFLL